MFLRATTRKKDGKEHRYFSVVENRRVSGGRVLQRHVLYLGEINGSQELAWRRSIEVLDEGTRAARTVVRNNSRRGHFGVRHLQTQSDSGMMSACCSWRVQSSG